ncbi:MAG TPA: stage II sporulation protein M [Verrucomicrobiae bacterium]|nr:stage II sporulation protein M [Verrucomicrobiae bacterium]
MTREEFESRHRPEWEELHALLSSLDARRRTFSAAAWSIRPGSPDEARFDLLYRAACRHLALARLRLYGTDLIDRLNDLALRGHRQLYGNRGRTLRASAERAAVEFPRMVRRRIGAVALAAALFVVPGLVAAAWVIAQPEATSALLDAPALRTLEEMYDPSSSHFGRARHEETNLGMFGYYVYHNGGIAFRTYAGGIFLGLGSIFFLLYNGLMIGAVMGHFATSPSGATFFPFVAGHSPFELTAIVLSGAAGISLGAALAAPGRSSRADALREAARGSIVLVAGASVMIVVAAFIEGFWSPLAGVAAPIKFAAGAILWLAVLGYLALAGGRDGS